MSPRAGERLLVRAVAASLAEARPDALRFEAMLETSQSLLARARVDSSRLRLRVTEIEDLVSWAELGSLVARATRMLEEVAAFEALSGGGSELDRTAELPTVSENLPCFELSGTDSLERRVRHIVARHALGDGSGVRPTATVVTLALMTALLPGTPYATFVERSPVPPTSEPSPSPMPTPSDVESPPKNAHDAPPRPSPAPDAPAMRAEPQRSVEPAPPPVMRPDPAPAKRIQQKPTTHLEAGLPPGPVIPAPAISTPARERPVPPLEMPHADGPGRSPAEPAVAADHRTPWTSDPPCRPGSSVVRVEVEGMAPADNEQFRQILQGEMAPLANAAPFPSNRPNACGVLRLRVSLSTTTRQVGTHYEASSSAKAVLEDDGGATIAPIASAPFGSQARGRSEEVAKQTAEALEAIRLARGAGETLHGL